VSEVDPQLAPVLEQARTLLGQNRVVVKGHSFRYDCSGFVRGVTSVLGVDVMAEAGEDGDNGVRLIHRWVERHGENHQRKLPRPGDVVYFDNTWDKNGNGKLDDPLTHVGLVESVGDDGTIQILHRANRGIVRDPMNLLRPHDTQDGMKRPINAILRPKGKRDPSATPHLMSELWAGFGTLRGPAVALLSALWAPPETCDRPSPIP
jgi:signal peptidase I